MCKIDHIRSTDCHHEWVSIIEPCGPDKNFSNCDSLAGDKLRRLNSRIRVCTVPEKCPLCIWNEACRSRDAGENKEDPNDSVDWNKVRPVRGYSMETVDNRTMVVSLRGGARSSSDDDDDDDSVELFDVSDDSDVSSYAGSDSSDDRPKRKSKKKKGKGKAKKKGKGKKKAKAGGSKGKKGKKGKGKSKKDKGAEFSKWEFHGLFWSRDNDYETQVLVCNIM